ncbi:hypothetical protein [Nostoc flagelliforme]|nr:hypothetical protein [Nostoc flagelliforme]
MMYSDPKDVKDSEAMPPEENVRVQIVISRYIYEKLQQWANAHGKSPSSFAGQIVSSRVEANLDIIDRMSNEKAELSSTDSIDEETQTSSLPLPKNKENK